MLYAFYQMLLVVKIVVTSVFVQVFYYVQRQSFLSISNFIPGTSFSIMLYQMPMDIFKWRRQSGNFNNRSSVSRCTIFLDVSIMSLFKLFIKFLCCVMSKVLILLVRIFTVITFCKSVICIYSRHISYFSLLANYLCQVWLCKLYINLSGKIELNPGPKSHSRRNFSV